MWAQMKRVIYIVIHGKQFIGVIETCHFGDRICQKNSNKINCINYKPN